MTLGSGIFLSALLLAVVVLFAVTKDRWKWGRIAAWSLVPVAALTALAASYQYLDWESPPQPQSSFYDLTLQAGPGDVRFVKGEPALKEGSGRWVYNVGTGVSDKESAQLMVQFEDIRIRFILYTSTEAHLRHPDLLGFTMGSSYQQVQDKLGTPDHISRSADDLDRMFSYDKLNVFFSFRQAQLVAYGIYNPRSGPMKFRGDPAAAASAR